MSWEDSDDDWENEPQPDAPKEAELTIDDIEEMERKKKEAEAAALAAKQPKKKKAEKEEEKKPEDVPYDVALQDPVAEKLRRQKLVEEADARMAKDLFSGIDEAPEEVEDRAKQEQEAAEKLEEEKRKKAAAKKAQTQVIDAWDSVNLKLQGDVDELSRNCLEKLESAKAKSAAHLFLTHLVKALEPALSTEELLAIEKKVVEIVKTKKVAATASKTEKKGEVKINKNTKFDIGKAFAESKYGDGDWDEDWEDDWYDDGTSAAYAPPKR